MIQFDLDSVDLLTPCRWVTGAVEHLSSHGWLIKMQEAAQWWCQIKRVKLHLFIKPIGLPEEVFTEDQHAYKSSGVLYIEAGEGDHGEKTSFIFSDLSCPPGGFRLSYQTLILPSFFFQVCTCFFFLLLHQYRICVVANMVKSYTEIVSQINLN